MQYTSDQFHPNEAWLIFRLPSFMQIKGKPADVYALVDCASTYVLGQITVLGEAPDEIEVHRVMKEALQTAKELPQIMYCIKNDPIVEIFEKYAESKNILFKDEPLSSFNKIITPLQKAFLHMQTSGNHIDESVTEQEDIETAMAAIPDSYDPCPCASGLKYKFCCKPIFQEIMEAMVEAEDGRYKTALQWMEKAKKKVGETAEVLCRYAIVHSYFDKAASNEYRDKCLQLYPNHPRANYIKGIDLKNSGDYKGAIKSYTAAIKNYPPNDIYHLNEVWNNIGSVYFEMKKYADAKAAWEKAIEYQPKDVTARRNLEFMIYQNPEVPDNVK